MRLFLQIAVIGFWLPSVAVDFLLLWRDHGGEELRFVFWLLFRQALVFLTLWFTVAGVHGLTRGSRSRGPSRRLAKRLRHKAATVATAAAPGRAYRGQ